ncbi:MAG: glycosyltransferase, partial [Pseudomonadota bacterium]
MADSAQKHIMIVTQSLHLGGTERHICFIAPHLRDAGWRVSIVCLSEPGILAKEMIALGITVYSPRQYDWYQKDNMWVWARRIWRTARGITLLRRLVDKDRPTIIHFFLPAAYFLGGVSLLGKRNLIKVMSRRSMNNYQKKYPVLRLVEGYLHKTMTAIMANSANAIRQLQEEGVPRKKLTLSYNGIPIPPLQRTEVDEFQIACLANLIPYKGHADLLQAAAKFHHRGKNIAWRLKIVGQDRGIGEELRSLAEALGIDQ